MDKLKSIFESLNFTNVDGNLDELQEEGKTKISMQFEETPALMDAINEFKEFEAYISETSDDLIIEKLS